MRCTSACTVGRDSVPRGLRLHLVGELIVLELLVALERDAVDDRVFHHGDDQPAAGLVDPHVLEQAGGVQRLERLVDLVAVEPLAGIEPEIGADGIGLDAAIAFDDDRGAIAPTAWLAVATAPIAAPKTIPARISADQTQPPKPPHPQRHAQRALSPFLPTGRRYCGTHSGPCLYRLFPTAATQLQCRVSPVSSRKLPPEFPQTVPMAQVRRQSRGQQLNRVVKDCKNHQHHDDREPDAEPDFLGPFGQRPAPRRPRSRRTEGDRHRAAGSGTGSAARSRPTAWRRGAAPA